MAEPAPPIAAPPMAEPAPPVVEPVETPATLLNVITDAELERARGIVARMSHAFARKVVGQERLRTSIMATLIAGGHILLESVPGLAKSTAAHTLADAVEANFRRIQCTPDLLPSDIIGTQIYDPSKVGFTTQLGPVHANIVLLDEINRSSAKTQSAMLEAMQERQTSIGGTVYRLPEPFLVIATQNPIEQEGTYLLPEAQLDRFLLKEVLDYPSAADELEILQRIDSGIFDPDAVAPVGLSLDDVRFLQEAAKRVFVEDSVRAYLVAIVQATRTPKGLIPDDLARLVEYGASPRASIAFIAAARAVALLEGRSFVVPEDIKNLAHRVLRHRVVLSFEADALEISSERVIDAIITAVPTP
ncbi:MAG TPA: MoxR family ATPase [Pseudolysinimonas sp.]|nr:MoxR family ATPase [Pseudolysinimonas sp.]